MPGAAYPDPTPSWLRPENASVLDPWWKKAARTITPKWIGAHDPVDQIMGVGMTNIPGPKAGLSALAQGVKQAAGGMVEKARTGIRAFHGSPHNFDRFDMRKLGTGQGAQAYGHGLYFAESLPVAHEYRDMGGFHPPQITLAGEALEPSFGHPLLRTDAQLRQGVREIDTLVQRNPYMTREHVADILRNRLDRTPSWEPDQRQYAADALRALDTFGDRLQIVPGKSRGHMYDVNLKVDPTELLDWDRPLSEQSPQVQDTLKRFGLYGPRQTVTGATYNPTGSEAYHAVGNRITTRPGDVPPGSLTGYSHEARQVHATNQLREAGIPGLRYLDGQSRSARLAGSLELDERFQRELVNEYRQRLADPALTGVYREWVERDLALAEKNLAEALKLTRNYVMFDDSLIDILRKYGLLPPLVGSAALAGRQSRPSQVGSPPPVPAPPAPRGAR